MSHLQPNEAKALQQLRKRDQSIRAYLATQQLTEQSTVRDHLMYVHELSRVAGNINNHASAVTCVLARHYLQAHHDVVTFDACEKPQGAKGLDIKCHLSTGERVIAEIKTTIPYLGTKLGSNQRTTYRTDLERLTTESAALKYFFVIDAGAAEEARRLLHKHAYDPSIRVINLLDDSAAQ